MDDIGKMSFSRFCMNLAGMALNPLSVSGNLLDYYIVFIDRQRATFGPWYTRYKENALRQYTYCKIRIILATKGKKKGIVFWLWRNRSAYTASFMHVQQHHKVFGRHYAEEKMAGIW